MYRYAMHTPTGITQEDIKEPGKYGPEEWKPLCSSNREVLYDSDYRKKTFGGPTSLKVEPDNGPYGAPGPSPPSSPPPSPILPSSNAWHVDYDYFFGSGTTTPIRTRSFGRESELFCWTKIQEFQK